MGGVKTTINKVKYIGIASLTIAILSVLTLNIISSYSSSNTLSNAEEVGSNSNSDSELSAQANDSSVCDNTNTNAAACISMSISLLILLPATLMMVISPFRYLREEA